MLERTALYPIHLTRLISVRKKIYKVVAQMSCEVALSNGTHSQKPDRQG